MLEMVGIDREIRTQQLVILSNMTLTDSMSFRQISGHAFKEMICPEISESIALPEHVALWWEGSEHQLPDTKSTEETTMGSHNKVFSLYQKGFEQKTKETM
jgi:hypothetical protein